MTSRRSRIYIDSERGEREDREVSHLTFFFGCRFFGGGESFVFRGSRMTWIFCRGTCVCSDWFSQKGRFSDKGIVLFFGAAISIAGKRVRGCFGNIAFQFDK